MRFFEINFRKKNKRPVTDTTYQIDAEEWNAIGTELSSQAVRISDLESSGGGTTSGCEVISYQDWLALKTSGCLVTGKVYYIKAQNQTIL